MKETIYCAFNLFLGFFFDNLMKGMLTLLIAQEHELFQYRVVHIPVLIEPDEMEKLLRVITTYFLSSAHVIVINFKSANVFGSLILYLYFAIIRCQ